MTLKEMVEKISAEKKSAPVMEAVSVTPAAKETAHTRGCSCALCNLKSVLDKGTELKPKATGEVMARLASRMAELGEQFSDYILHPAKYIPKDIAANCRVVKKSSAGLFANPNAASSENLSGRAVQVYTMNASDALGIKRIGSGAYSIIYDIGDPQFVLKVVKSSDDGYDGFLRALQDNDTASNPLLPLVIEGPIWEAGHKTFLIEKLEDDTFNGVHNTLTAVFWANKGLLDLDLCLDLDVGDARIQQAIDIISRPPDNCNLDLHDGNFLYRANGCPVITDPWA